MTSPSWSDYGTYDESAHPDLWSGVVGYWAPCLGRTGLRLHDVSRYNNWGALTNMDAATDWVIDGGQYALDFDGSNDFVLIGSQSALSGAFARMTKAIWIRPAQTAIQKYVFADFNTSGTTSRLSISHDTKAKAFQNTATSLTSTTTLAIGQWYHIVVTRNDGTGAGNTGLMSLYLNGVLEASTSYSYTSPVLQVSGEQLSRSNATYGDYYSGLSDEAAIWNRALTPNEVRSLYQLGRGGMLERRRRRRYYSVQADVVKSYLFVNRGQVIGGGTL